jgi:CHASE2 domain-containing sensor protein
VLLTSLTVLGMLMGIRQMGWLQAWELQAYDHLMRTRPAEKPDSRLLIIENTASDIEAQPEKNSQGSLSNQILSQLLDKLEPYQPDVIGVDIFRKDPVDAKYQSLINRLQRDDNLITTCYSRSYKDDLDASPAPEVPHDRVSGWVGFANNVVDEPEKAARRYLMDKDIPSDSACKVNISLAYLAAWHYLSRRDIKAEQNEATHEITIGSVLFKTLNPNSGGYHQNRNMGGNQVMLNYRANESVAETLTVADVLRGNKLSQELVKGRIVLIGTNAPLYADSKYTPSSWGTSYQMPGIEFHAHMVSQILSAVLDQRPLIWWLSEEGEWLWIGCWSMVGGLIAWRCRSRWAIGITGASAIALYGCCYLVLSYRGGWLPLIPSTLALVATAGAVIVLKTQIADRSFSNILR